MNSHLKWYHKIIIGILLSVLCLALIIHHRGYDSSIGWNITTTAESTEFGVFPFQKGPFQFAFEGEYYTLAESFSAGPIDRYYGWDGVFLLINWFGLILILAGSTMLPRFWFFGITGAFMFLLINLRLSEVSIFGIENSSVENLILLALFVIPAYLFHFTFPGIKILWRIVVFMLVLILVLVVAKAPILLIQEQYIAGSYFPMVILSIILLLLVGEEIIYAILYLITKARGSSNHVHFMVFSFAYLITLGLYYAKKASLIRIDFALFDPFFLFVISVGITVWTLRFKEGLLSKEISTAQIITLFSGLAIAVFSFIGFSHFRGNDPVYQGLNYFIVYIHLAFGAMFFFYILLNFLDPLTQGLSIYKIAYKERNFPYVTAKLGGLAIVAGFFFLADKGPLRLFQSGYFNFLGAQAETLGEARLAGEYFREGAIYGYDNHFSNYKLAYKELQTGDTKESNYRFGRATNRFPSAQAYVNHSSTHAILGESTPSLVALQEGLREFPGDMQVKNNLALTYADIGKMEVARDLLSNEGSQSGWNQASQVNLWKVSDIIEPDAIADAYAKGNLAVKSNILSCVLRNGVSSDLSFDTTYLYPSYPLHRLVFMINASWYFDGIEVYEALDKSLQGALDESVYWSAKKSVALNYYQSGYVNQSLKLLDELAHEATGSESAKYYNYAGLIALSEHALSLAEEFFLKAVDEGFDKAKINLIAAQLESGKFEDAESLLKKMVSQDSTFTALLEDISSIDQPVNSMSQAQQVIRLYYKYSNYTPAEIFAALSTSDSLFAQSLWTKMSQEMLLNDLGRLGEYRGIFENMLPKRSFETYELFTGYRRPDKVDLERLREKASRNALNVPLVIYVSDLLSGEDLSGAYDLLVGAIDIHRTSAELHKKYALIALKFGLSEYAQEVLPTIKALTNESRYNEFEKEFNQLADSLERSSSW